MNRAAVLVTALGAGLVLGGAIGSSRYAAIVDHRPVCASCHHGSSELAQLETPPPHSTEFQANCHSCHVLPVKQYLQYTTALVGLAPPVWVDSMKNPTFGGQTCLECHLARGRGVIACEQCHSEGTLTVSLTEKCEACHEDHVPLDPHSRVNCHDCHAEVYLDPQGRARQLMDAKLHGHHAPEAP